MCVMACTPCCNGINRGASWYLQYVDFNMYSNVRASVQYSNQWRQKYKSQNKHRERPAAQTSLLKLVSQVTHIASQFWLACQ